MKNLFLKYFLGVVVVFLFSSCSFVNGSYKFNKDRLASTESSPNVFVKTRDGQTITFNKLKVSMAYGKENFLIGDGKRVKVKFEDIMAFQTNKTYYKRLFTTIVPYEGKPMFYDYFGERLRKGKINLYTISEASGASQAKTMTYHPASQNGGAYTTSNQSTNSAYKSGIFLQKNDGSIERLSQKLLKELISDNQNATDKFDNLYKKTNPLKSAMKILDLYNN